MPPESPLFFGMHPNAEIDFRTKMHWAWQGVAGFGLASQNSELTELRCETIFELLLMIQPKRSPGQERGRLSVKPRTPKPQDPKTSVQATGDESPMAAARGLRRCGKVKIRTHKRAPIFEAEGGRDVQ